MSLASQWSINPNDKGLSSSLCAPTDIFVPTAVNVSPLNYKKCSNGTHLLGVVKSVDDLELIVSLPNGLEGRVSALKISREFSARVKAHLTDHVKELPFLQSLYKNGNIIQCTVIESHDNHHDELVDLSVQPRDVNSQFSPSDLILGMTLPGSISSKEDHGYTVNLGIKNVMAFLPHESARSVKETFDIGEVVLCCVVSNKGVKKNSASLRHNVQVKVDSQSVNKTMKYCSKPQNILPASKVPAVVKQIGCGMKVKVFSKPASIHRDHMLPADAHLIPGSQIEARVLYTTKKGLSLTRLPHLMHLHSDQTSIFANVTAGRTYKGFRVLSHNEQRVELIFREKIPAFCPYNDLSSDGENIRRHFPENSMRRAKIGSLNYVERNMRVSLLWPKRVTEEVTESLTSVTKRKSPFESDQSVEKSVTKKLKRKDSKDSHNSSKDSQAVGISCGFSWDNEFHLPTERQTPDEEFNDSTEKTAAFKKSFKAQVEEEKRLFELEKDLASRSKAAQTPEAFERLLLQSPDSSLIWLRYMAHHLEMSEVERARHIAERALDTISYREGQEKWNVWVALMNLEAEYGTAEGLQQLLLKAAQCNDPWKAYHQLLQIHLRSHKYQEAEALLETMRKKFKRDKKVWIENGTFLYNQGRAEQARAVLNRSLASLDKSEHVDVISKFSQLECQRGQLEIGKSMYEKLLATYPRRSDLWSVYIDIVVKAGQIKEARQIFERLIHLSLPVKRMKVFFKKYVEFETRHGSVENVELVKQKARDYVESNM